MSIEQIRASMVIIALYFVGVMTGYIAHGGCECTTIVEPTTAWECTTVVGNKWFDTQVDRCYDPVSKLCYLVARKSAILQVECVEHPFAE